MDSASYIENLASANAQIQLPDNSKLAIVAANWPDNNEIVDGDLVRPGGRIVAHDVRPHVNAQFHVHGQSDDSELVLDGLLIEGRIVVMPGDLGRLQISHCTVSATEHGLDGTIDIATPVGDEDEPVVINPNLVIDIDHTIVGALEFSQAISRLIIQDSIVNEDRTAGSSGAGLMGIDTVDTDAVILRSTIYGRVGLRTLSADNSIFTGELDILRRQQGCIRFSYVKPTSITPRRYRCQPDFALKQFAKTQGLDSASKLTIEQRHRITARVQPVFTSSRYGEAAFSQLDRHCPDEIYKGGEDGAEMGVFYSLKQPQREQNLTIALNEYLRFGLEAGIFFTT